MLHRGQCSNICCTYFCRVLVQVMDDYSSRSFSLLAMAVGVIPNVHSLDLSRMTQHQIEGCAVNMELLSLVVTTNSVREDSKSTMRCPGWVSMSLVMQMLKIAQSSMHARCVRHACEYVISECCQSSIAVVNLMVKAAVVYFCTLSRQQPDTGLATSPQEHS